MYIFAPWFPNVPMWEQFSLAGPLPVLLDWFTGILVQFDVTALGQGSIPK